MASMQAPKRRTLRLLGNSASFGERLINFGKFENYEARIWQDLIYLNKSHCKRLNVRSSIRTVSQRLSVTEKPIFYSLFIECLAIVRLGESFSIELAGSRSTANLTV